MLWKMVHSIDSICDSWAKTLPKLWYDHFCLIAKMSTNQRHELNHKMLVPSSINLWHNTQARALPWGWNKLLKNTFCCHQTMRLLSFVKDKVLIYVVAGLHALVVLSVIKQVGCLKSNRSPLNCIYWIWIIWEWIVCTKLCRHHTQNL